MDHAPMEYYGTYMYIYELRLLASHGQTEVATERTIQLSHTKKALKQLDLLLLF